MNKWFIHFPCDMYAFEVYDKTSERAVRAWAREFFGYKRLPAGVQVWRKETKPSGFFR